MNPRRIVILAVAAVVAIVAAVLLANRATRGTPGANELLYPDLKAQADSVTAIRIYGAGDARALEIVRHGADWTLTQRNGYPIASVKARNLVRALSSAKILEEKTADASKYATLSVEDVSDANAQGVRIELEGPATAVNLIVGKDGPGGKSSYVRRAGEPKSWLIGEQLSASTEARDWLQKDIVNVSADRIHSGTIAIAAQKPYTAAKTTRADADFKIESLPRGKELASASAANGVATALLDLSLDDVRPKTELATDKPSAQATFKTFDGLVVQLEGFTSDDKHYVTVTTSYDAALAERFEVKVDAAANEAPKAEGLASESSASNVEDEAKTTAAKLAGWAYEIPGYKYDAIFRPLDEMLQK